MHKTVENLIIIQNELKSKIIDDHNWKKVCEWALQQHKKSTLCALIIKRE